MANEPSPFLGAVRAPLVSKEDGTPTYIALKLFQDWDTRLTNGLNKIGQLTGDITPSVKIAGRAGSVSAALQHIDSGGVLAASAISGVVSPGSLPVAALGTIGGVQANNPVPHQWVNSIDTAGMPVTSQPGYGDIAGTPILPADAPATAHNWLNSYSAASGVFTEARPDYSDLTGTPTGASGSITLAALTGLGTQGSITVVNGIITAFVNPT